MDMISEEYIFTFISKMPNIYLLESFLVYLGQYFYIDYDYVVIYPSQFS